MPSVLHENLVKIAEHLNAQINEAGSVVITGIYNTLTLAPMASDCVAIIATDDSVVCGPHISFPLIAEVQFGRDWVVLIAHYRDSYRARAQIFSDGAFRISGPTYDQASWLCDLCGEVGQVRYSRNDADVMSVSYLIEDDHHRVSRDCEVRTSKIRILRANET